MSIFYCDVCQKQVDSDFIESKLLNGYMICDEHEVKNIIFSSCGNDSIALVQWAFDNDLDNINVAYSDTQWAAKSWAERVDKVKSWIEQNGGEFHAIESEGFESLAKRKKAFPTNGMAFCSYELKIKPAMEWLDVVDPLKLASCYIGVMRIESNARAEWQEVKESSPNHGGRRLVSPLAKMTLAQRDELLLRSGFDILPHRSLECSPCVNANRRDLQMLPNDDVQKVHELEVVMGVGERSGKHKYMFRQAKHGGACGIKEVKDRADHGGGQYSPLQDDMFGCDSGMCGG